MNSQEELTASELVFSGILEGLSPAEAVALISALVFQVSFIFAVSASCAWLHVNG